MQPTQPTHLSKAAQYSKKFRLPASLTPLFQNTYLKLWLKVALISVGVGVVTRIALLLEPITAADTSIVSMLGVFLRGLVSDIPVALAVAMPFALLLMLLPRRAQVWLPIKLVFLALLVIYTFTLLSVGVSEITFWREFGVRFNFIAVDYLVYTQEVLGNIRESYPVGLIFSALGAAALLIAALFAKKIAASMETGGTHTRRLPALIIIAAAFVTLWLPSQPSLFQNAYNNELADNGLRSFVAAFKANELDYARFYATLPEAEVKRELSLLTDKSWLAMGPREPQIRPALFTQTPATRRPNLVMISMESMSADFMAHFGNKKGITPNLDKLADEGMLFTRLYATGTRTVRGLESLSLAIPPTPGQSVVRRPNNDNLYTLGRALQQTGGYQPHFYYGGYGMFDNMNAYFAGNGYQVTDRTDFPEGSAPFGNVWGVADEYLLDQAISLMDKQTSQDDPTFVHVMTTSNHRPYTYPENRIDIPSGSGRDGAVKYTDWAIGDFIEKAKHKPWFANTVFIIVADHCAGSSGKTSLPVPRYHIPAIVYAPGKVPAKKIDRLASQIDLAPTLLAMLGLDAGNRFLGRNILTTPASDERAFISNYQELGYLKKDTLTILSPNQKIAAYKVTEGRDSAEAITPDPQLVREAIAYYQGASMLLKP